MSTVRAGGERSALTTDAAGRRRTRSPHDASTTTEHGVARGGAPQPHPKHAGGGTASRGPVQLANEWPARAGRRRIPGSGGWSGADHSAARGTGGRIGDIRGTTGGRSFGTDSPLLHVPPCSSARYTDSISAPLRGRRRKRKCTNGAALQALRTLC